jgi:tetratricopeptide (TPR) repeat protein
MNFLFAQAILFLWLPIVVVFFLAFPPRRAVVISFVAGCLGLPNIGFGLPGLPDYTKVTATVYAVLLCSVLFDQSRLVSFRPRWYDWPMVVWCLSPFVTAILNNLGPHEGLSVTLDPITFWGLPYLIGRVYFTDLEGLRELALGFAIGGLVYVPFCFFEMRFSPITTQIVYGFSSWEMTGLRYGGYRPRVFLRTGLELGMWMANATLICYQLWYSGAVKRIRNFSMGFLTLVLIVTSILCKSTGAILLLFFGIAILWVTKRTRWSWILLLVVAIPPAYSISRGFNLWSGKEAVDLIRSTLGEERAQSCQYRLDMENLLAGRAREQPIFGWGRFNRNQVISKAGRVQTVPDGYWIIAFGVNGLVSLIAMLAMMLQPMLLTIRRFPPATWSDPRVGPVVVMAMVLVLEMFDFLSNAMPSPLYPLVIGAVMGQSAVRLGSRRQDAEASLANAADLMAEGRAVEAEMEFRQAIEFASDGDDLEGRQTQAEALDGLGHSLLATGRAEEAELAFRDALAVRDWLAAKTSDPGRYRDLAIAREGLSRTLVEIGRTAEAIEERRIALRIWDILAADHPRNSEYRDHRLDALNDLAWLLATDPDPRRSDPVQALRMAEEAVRISADHLASWNTLGVARYRAGDWAGAIEALEHSVLSSSDGQGTAFDHFFMTMAWSQLQHQDRAREWLERGMAWVSRHRPGHPVLERFREEAETLLMSEHGSENLDVS